MTTHRCEICQRKMVAPRRGRGFRQCQGCSDRALEIANEQDVDFGTALELARDEFIDAAQRSADAARTERLYRQARRDYDRP
jgi:hypothetical protein